MTTGKKIIKYLSMAFAIFLTFTIISGITNGIYSLISVFSDSSGNGDVRVLWNNDNTNIDDIDIDLIYNNLNIVEFLKLFSNDNFIHNDITHKK